MSPLLPIPRGPLSRAVIDRLAGRPGTDATLTDPGGHLDRLDHAAALVDDDLHLALWCGYELHHHGFAGVDDRLEWDPDLIRFRRCLEGVFEAALRAEAAATPVPADPAGALAALAERPSPPLASTVEAEATLDQLREVAVHRSIYQLKEADGHTFGLPRLRGPGRDAYVEIQMDEYGNGRTGHAHADLFAAALAELGLDPRLGGYLDRVPGTTLATDNLVELFALNRRLRGALVGHLALFEVTSVVPMSRYLRAAQRLGGGRFPALERFYAVHVEADVHHGDLARTALVGGLLADEPDLAADVVFGAVALANVEGRFADHLLRCWRRGDSSLLPAPADRPASGPARLAVAAAAGG